MTVLILGATGRTGKHLLAQTLQKDYLVHILVRDKSKVLNADGLVIFEGLPTDKISLANAAKGCHAIVSVLNISRTSDFPWAALRTPKTFLSDSIKNILEVANEQEQQFNCSFRAETIRFVTIYGCASLLNVLNFNRIGVSILITDTVNSLG